MGVKYGDVDVVGSPHQVDISPSATVDPSKCTADWPELPGESSRETSFYVTLRDTYENIVGAAELVGGRWGMGHCPPRSRAHAHACMRVLSSA